MATFVISGTDQAQFAKMTNWTEQLSTRSTICHCNIVTFLTLVTFCMESLEQIKTRAEAVVPGSKIDIIANPGPAHQPSLLIDNEHASAVVKFLRDDPALRLDFCSNATGVDWLDRTVKKTVKVKRVIDGEEKEVDETKEEKVRGYLEAVYHRYSMARKISRRNRDERDDPNTRASRATTNDNGRTARGRVDGSVDGTAASLDPWGVSHERRARGRDRAQAQTRFRIPPS